MAVKILFDNQHNVVQPTIVLATRSGEKIGMLPAEEVYFADNLNSASELQFKVHKGIDIDLWNDIVDFKLVWCPEWDIWFEIGVEISESDESVKIITGTSVGEAELSQINLYSVEINTESDIARDDYTPTVLYNSRNHDASLIHRILEKAPHFTVGTVDESLKNIQRVFHFDNKSIYDALMEISTEVDCLIEIDSGTNAEGIVARRINIYDLCTVCVTCGERGRYSDVCPNCGGTDLVNSFGEDTNVFISAENLADDITFSTDKDSVKNCFRLVAGDDLMTSVIRTCNPNGTDYIWYLSEDFRTDMTAELQTKLSTYDELYQYYKTQHSVSVDANLLTQYNALVDKYAVYNTSLAHINSPIVGHSNLITAYYNSLDFGIFLESAFMPTPSNATSNASIEALKITPSALSPIAVTNLQTLTESSATSAVLGLAKTLINPGFQIRVRSCSLVGTNWTGSFTVTNYSDEEDSFTTADISVSIVDTYEQYVRQKLSKCLYDKSGDSSDIVALFGLSLTSFTNEIKKYCLDSLKMFKEVCLACMNILIEQGAANNKNLGNNSNFYDSIYMPYYNKELALSSEIKLRESELAIIQGTYDSNDGVIDEGAQSFLKKEIKIIRNALDMEKYLGKKLTAELASYRREQSFENSNYISDGLDNATLVQNANDFIKTAENELFKSSTLQHSISTTLKNLLIMKEFAPIVDHFAVGNWIVIRVDDKIYKLRLIKYSISFDSLDRFQVEFSDVIILKNSTSDVESILSNAASMSTSYDYVARQADQGKSAKNYLDDWVSRGLSLTKMRIIDNAANQNLQIDDKGVLCREYIEETDSYDDKQLRIINRGLYLTDNGWRSARAGIGNFTYYDPETNQELEDYGVIASTIVGNLILSNEVGVYNKTGSIKLDENGLLLVSRESGVTNVFKIQRESLDGTLVDVVYFDNQGNAHFNGVLNAATGTFAGALNAATGTFAGELSAATGTFAGTLSAATGTFSGELNAATGTFAGSLSAATGTFAGTLSAATGSFAGSLSAATGTFAGSLSAATGTFAGTLSAACITTGTLMADRIASKSLDGTKIADNGIVSDNIAPDAITSDKIAANAITANKIAANAITADKIGTGVIIANAGRSTWDLDTGILLNEGYLEGTQTLVSVEIKDGQVRLYYDEVLLGGLWAASNRIQLFGDNIYIGDDENAETGAGAVSITPEGVEINGKLILGDIIGSHNYGIDSDITIGSTTYVFHKGILVYSY